MSSETVTVEVEVREGSGEIAVLTVANPERLNALSSKVVAAFASRIAELEKLAELRVVILQGAGGRAFIGGADINELAKLSKKKQ